MIVEPLFWRESLWKATDDPTGEGDVSSFDFDARGAREGAENGQERMGGERGGFVGVGVDDRGCGHLVCFPGTWLRSTIPDGIARKKRF